MRVENRPPNAGCCRAFLWIDDVSEKSSSPSSPLFSSSTTATHATVLAQGVLGQLASRLDQSLTRRCLIVEDTCIPGNVLESLTFLTPGTRYRDWAAKYPSAVHSSGSSSSSSNEKETETHHEQIVWNTLNQLLSNLSVAEKLPNNEDSVIAAQVHNSYSSTLTLLF